MKTFFYKNSIDDYQDLNSFTVFYKTSHQDETRVSGYPRYHNSQTMIEVFEGPDKDKIADEFLRDIVDALDELNNN